MTERVMTDEEIYERFSRMVSKQDYWRGYFGYEVEDEEVLGWLDRAHAAMSAAPFPLRDGPNVP